MRGAQGESCALHAFVSLYNLQGPGVTRMETVATRGNTAGAGAVCRARLQLSSVSL